MMPARPSSPSVKFTALLKPTIQKTAIGIHNRPMSIFSITPGMATLRQLRRAEVQHQRNDRRDQHLERHLGARRHALAFDALAAHVFPIVDRADDGKGHHRPTGTRICWPMLAMGRP